MNTKFNYKRKKIFLNSLKAFSLCWPLSTAQGMMKSPCTGDFESELTSCEGNLTFSVDSSKVPDEIQEMLNLIYPKNNLKKVKINTLEINEEIQKLKKAEAQFEQGYRYWKGNNVEQNYSKAVECYKRAAQLGSTGASYQLGYAHWKGIGVNQNFSKALDYFQEAAKDGFSDAYLNIGHMYLAGEGVEKDTVKAFKNYEIAAQQENAIAQFNVGSFYEFGIGNIEKDFIKAREYYEKAAAQGHMKAIFNLGIMYYQGTGVDQDSEKALLYFNKIPEADGVKNVIEKIESERHFQTPKTALLNLKKIGHKNSIPLNPVVSSSIEAIPKIPHPNGSKEEKKKDVPVESICMENSNMELLPIKKSKKPVKKILDSKIFSRKESLEKDKEKEIKLNGVSKVKVFKPSNPTLEQISLSEQSERSDSLKPSRLRPLKSLKKKWHDTSEKSGKEKKEQKKAKSTLKRKSVILTQSESEVSSFSRRSRNERSFTSQSARSGVETSFQDHGGKTPLQRIEFAVQEKKFEALANCFNRDVRFLKQVVLKEEAILKTLETLKDLGIINYSIKKARKTQTFHATHRSGGINPASFTAHDHDHDLPWYEQKNVRDDFFGFIRACGLEPLQFLQVVQPVFQDIEADMAKSDEEQN